MSRPPAEPFDCARVEARLDSYLQDQAPQHERRGIRRHVETCPACFDKVVARDPLKIFAPLADEEAGEEAGVGGRGSAFWDGFWPGIEEAIAREEAIRPARRAGRAPRYAWGALAAAALLAAGLAIARWGLPGWPAGAPGGGAAPGVAPPQVAGISAPSAAGSRPVPQTVERVRGARANEVQVYSMKYVQEPAAGGPAGSEAQVTELVLIVDAGLDL